MKYNLMKTALYLGIFLCTSCNKTTISPFWEIPDPYFDEIAMIRADPNFGTAVIYNPETCKKIGDACGFFRLHAFSHEHLRHGLLGEPDDYPISSENAADCFAAQYGKPNEVYAAYKLFLNKNRDPDLRIHGDPEHRAELIKSCAIQKDNWIG